MRIVYEINCRKINVENVNNCFLEANKIKLGEINHQRATSKDLTFKWLMSKYDTYEEEASFYSPISPSINDKNVNYDLFGRYDTRKLFYHTK